MTTKLAGEVGYQLLWLIIAGCVIKVFVQIELGRYAVSKGKTTLQALDTIPGPRLVVSWLVWLWLFMYLATVFQLVGIVGGTGITNVAYAVEIYIRLIHIGRYRAVVVSIANGVAV